MKCIMSMLLESCHEKAGVMRAATHSQSKAFSSLTTSNTIAEGSRASSFSEQLQNVNGGMPQAASAFYF
jgi:hypothetical protein